MPFIQGQSGNPGGRPKLPWTFQGLYKEELEEMLTTVDGNPIEAKKAVAKRIVKMAIEGDINAIKELANRIEGMPIAKQEIFGKDGQPLQINIIAYGANDPINVPIQLQTNEVHDTSIGQPKEISGPKLAQESPEDNSGNKPTDQVGS